MNSLKKFLYLLVTVVIVIGACWIIEQNYSFIFARHVSGVIVDVQRVNSTLAVIGSQSGASDASMFSFAVAIRDEHGTIHTASTEDRQWAVAKPGFCAEAKFYPYPPWDLNSAGTYQNARLIQLRDCTPTEKAAQGNLPSAGTATIETAAPPAVAPGQTAEPAINPAIDPANKK